MHHPEYCPAHWFEATRKRKKKKSILTNKSGLGLGAQQFPFLLAVVILVLSRGNAGTATAEKSLLDRIHAVARNRRFLLRTGRLGGCSFLGLWRRLTPTFSTATPIVVLRGGRKIGGNGRHQRCARFLSSPARILCSIFDAILALRLIQAIIHFTTGIRLDIHGRRVTLRLGVAGAARQAFEKTAVAAPFPVLAVETFAIFARYIAVEAVPGRQFGFAAAGNPQHHRFEVGTQVGSVRVRIQSIVDRRAVVGLLDRIDFERAQTYPGVGQQSRLLVESLFAQSLIRS